MREKQKKSAVLTTLLFLAIPASIFARPLSLPPQELRYLYGPTYCGRLGTSWTPGRILRNGKFDSYSGRLRRLRRKLKKKKKRNHNTTRLRRNIRATRRKLRRATPECISIKAVPSVLPTHTIIPATSTLAPANTILFPATAVPNTSTPRAPTATIVSTMPPTPQQPAATAIPTSTTTQLPTATATERPNLPPTSVPPTPTTVPTVTPSITPSNTPLTEANEPELSDEPFSLSISLVDPCTNETIKSNLANNGDYNFSEIPRNAVLSASTNKIVGSIQFLIDGQVERTESSPPYGLAGDRSGDFLGMQLPLGTHSFTIRAFSLPSGEGRLIGSRTVEVNLRDSSSIYSELPVLKQVSALKLSGPIAGMKIMPSGCLRVGHKAESGPVLSDLDFRGETQQTIPVRTEEPFQPDYQFDFATDGAVVVNERYDYSTPGVSDADFKLSYFSTGGVPFPTWSVWVKEVFPNLDWSEIAAFPGTVPFDLFTIDHGLLLHGHAHGYDSSLAILSNQGEIVFKQSKDIYFIYPTGDDYFLLNDPNPEADCALDSIKHVKFNASDNPSTFANGVTLSGYEEGVCDWYRLVFDADSAGIFGIMDFYDKHMEFFSKLPEATETTTRLVDIDAQPILVRILSDKAIVLFKTFYESEPFAEKITKEQYLGIFRLSGRLLNLQTLDTEFNIVGMHRGIGGQIYLTGADGEIQLLQ